MSVQDLIDRYEVGGPLLAYAVTGLELSHAIARSGPGAWSIAELVAHLLDADLVGSDRMKRVIAEENPTLLAFDQDAWIARLDSHAMPVDEAVRMFVDNRRWMARILRGLPDTDYSRSGLHTERGPLTLAELVAGYVSHLDHHLRFLYAKRASIGVAIQPRYSFH
ncbi:DinB family protein [Isosphaeraceae bacterium EP7]